VSSAVIELLPSVEQPTAAAPFAATNLILAAAEALGRLARIESIAAGKSIEEARLCGHAVTVSRLALAIDDLVTTQQALVEVLQSLVKHDTHETKYAGQTLVICPSCSEQDGKHDNGCDFVKARAALARVEASA
jgi:hypothetical protein